MMDFAPARRGRRRSENIVPMINVVFLLLIFFLMSAEIAPPEPFDVTLPESAQSSDLTGDDTLYVSATGAVSYQGQSDAQAWSALQNRDTDASLTVRADAGLSASNLAALLPQLAEAGVSSVFLAAGQR